MVVSGSGSVMKISSSCHLEAVPEGLIGTRDLILVEYFSFSFFDFRSAHTRDVSLIKLARVLSRWTLHGSDVLPLTLVLLVY